MQKDPLTAVAAATVGVVAAARATRLVTKDHWPPMSFVRRKYVELTKGTEWSVLAECPFCVAPYVVAADLAWALRSDLGKRWWVANGWFAASYAASLIVVRDDVPDRTINVKSEQTGDGTGAAPPPSDGAAPRALGLPGPTVGALG